MSRITHLSRREHVLKRPDNYIGSNIFTPLTPLPILEQRDSRVEARTIHTPHIQGLQQIVTEITCNARDRTVEDPSCKTVQVVVKNGAIRVQNDGEGIPCVPIQVATDELKDATQEMYMPEVAFGVFQSSSNFDDERERITGGRNGLGAKLTVVFSKQFDVESVDSVRKLKYKQQFRDNMGSRSKPKITSCKAKPYTRVQFVPDWEKLNVPTGWTGERSDPDAPVATSGVSKEEEGGETVADTSCTDPLEDWRIVSQLRTLVWEMGACLNSSHLQKNVSVKWQGKRAPMRTFKQLASVYLGGSYLYASVADETYVRFEVAIGPAHASALPQDRGFINGLPCSEGTVHSYVYTQLQNQLSSLFPSSTGKKTFRTSQIQSKVRIMYNVIMVNPSFASQNKEYCTTPHYNWGFKWVPDDTFTKQLKRSELHGIFRDMAERMKRDQSAKQQDSVTGDNTYYRRGISNVNVKELYDAELAGHKNRKQVTSLYITEGKSARTWILSGLPGRRVDGALPVKGVTLNVTQASEDRILKNKEIQDIITALGLDRTADYSDPAKRKTLRYDRVVIAADNDDDGVHIRCLLLANLIALNPSLAKIQFIYVLLTPLIMVLPTKGVSETLYFYSQQAFEGFVEQYEGSVGALNPKSVKYNKGLGSMNSSIARRYLRDPRFVVPYSFREGWRKQLDRMVGSDNADRKRIVRDYDPGVHLDYETMLQDGSADYQSRSKRKFSAVYEDTAPDGEDNVLSEQVALSFDAFVQHEYPRYARSTIVRHIPHVLDGMKDSQRKVLFTFLQKNWTECGPSDMRAGAVKEYTQYHHDESSLPIVEMARDHPGSGINLSCIRKDGVFGSWHSKDSAAAPRYANTGIEPWARLLFRPEDIPVLPARTVEGHPVEPAHMCPILPMVLVNQQIGLSVGFHTKILPHDPLQVHDLTRAYVLYRQARDTGAADVASARDAYEAHWPQLQPHFYGYAQQPESVDRRKFVSRGAISLGETYGGVQMATVTALPVGVWIDRYVEAISKSLRCGPYAAKKSQKMKAVRTFKNMSSSTEVNIHLDLNVEWLDTFRSPEGELDMEALRVTLCLQNTLGYSCMNVLNKEDQVTKFETPRALFEYYADYRLELYRARHEHQIQTLQEQLDRDRPKLRFVSMVVDGSLVIGNKSEDEVRAALVEAGLPEQGGSYNYLLDMKMRSLTRRTMERMRRSIEEGVAQQEAHRRTTTYAAWLSELDEFRPALEHYVNVEKRERWFSTEGSDAEGEKSSKPSKRRRRKRGH